MEDNNRIYDYVKEGKFCAETVHFSKNARVIIRRIDGCKDETFGAIKNPRYMGDTQPYVFMVGSIIEIFYEKYGHNEEGYAFTKTRIQLIKEIGANNEESNTHRYLIVTDSKNGIYDIQIDDPGAEKSIPEIITTLAKNIWGKISVAILGEKKDKIC